MNNIHATLVSLNNKGILLIGKSGSGKSDLALRIIMEKGALLVADDRVCLKIENGKLFGFSPDEIKGKMEIRNVGIIETDYIKDVEIVLCVELFTDRNLLERLPTKKTISFLGADIDKLDLYPFDCSTIYKIIQKITGKFI